MSLFEKLFGKETKLSCEIVGGQVMLRYSDKELAIDISNVKRIDFAWDFGPCYLAGLIFYLKSDCEISFNGHILDEPGTVEKMRQAFPGFMRDIELNSFLNEAPMYGEETFWSNNV